MVGKALACETLILIYYDNVCIQEPIYYINKE